MEWLHQTGHLTVFSVHFLLHLVTLDTCVCLRLKYYYFLHQILLSSHLLSINYYWCHIIHSALLFAWTLWVLSSLPLRVKQVSWLKQGLRALKKINWEQDRGEDTVLACLFCVLFESFLEKQTKTTNCSAKCKRWNEKTTGRVNSLHVTRLHLTMEVAYISQCIQVR